jgi:hypothetical protein
VEATFASLGAKKGLFLNNGTFIVNYLLLNEKHRMMDNVLDVIEKMKIIPVAKTDAAANTLPLAKALKSGRPPRAEITFRTDAAEEAVRQLSAED